MATTDASLSGSTAPASPDTAEFTFTDHGPWVVEPDKITWTAGSACSDPPPDARCRP